MLSGYTSGGIVFIPQSNTDPLFNEEKQDPSEIEIMSVAPSPPRLSKSDIERMIDEANGDNAKVIRQLMQMRQPPLTSSTPIKSTRKNHITDNEAPSDEDIKTPKKSSAIIQLKAENNDGTCNNKLWQDFENIQQEIRIKTPKQSRQPQPLRNKTPQSLRTRRGAKKQSKKSNIDDNKSQSSKQSFLSWRMRTATTTTGSIAKNRNDKNAAAITPCSTHGAAANRSFLSESSIEAQKTLFAKKQKQRKGKQQHGGSRSSKVSLYSTPSIEKSSSWYSHGDESTDYGPVHQISTRRSITGGNSCHPDPTNRSSIQQMEPDVTDSLTGLEVVFTSPSWNRKDENDDDDLSVVSDINDDAVSCCESQTGCAAVRDYGPVNRRKPSSNPRGNVNASTHGGGSGRHHSRSIDHSLSDDDGSFRRVQNTAVYNHEEIIRRRMDIEAKLKALLNDDDCDDLTAFLSAGGPKEAMESLFEDDVKENVSFQIIDIASKDPLPHSTGQSMKVAS
jgi:hypothetical protein